VAVVQCDYASTILYAMGQICHFHSILQLAQLIREAHYQQLELEDLEDHAMTMVNFGEVEG